MCGLYRTMRSPLFTKSFSARQEPRKRYGDLGRQRGGGLQRAEGLIWGQSRWHNDRLPIKFGKMGKELPAI